MKKYLQLFRVKHYLKNSLIFLPLFFSGNILNTDNLIKSIIGFVIFSLLASSIYIFNDIVDVEQDKKHVKKKNRPIASGVISIKKAKIILILTYIVIISFLLLLTNLNLFTNLEIIYSTIVLGIYFIINILYSKWLKHVAILDVIILALGFLLRIIYGGTIISVTISDWLYLTILSISLYMALGKRKGELTKNGNKSRKVLNSYSIQYLNNFMNIFLTAIIIFYSLWCTLGFENSSKSIYLVYSIILVIFIIMRYSLTLENSLGDPIDLIYSDKILIISTLIYTVYMGVVIYG